MYKHNFPCLNKVSGEMNLHIYFFSGKMDLLKKKFCYNIPRPKFKETKQEATGTMSVKSFNDFSLELSIKMKVKFQTLRRICLNLDKTQISIFSFKFCVVIKRRLLKQDIIRLEILL